MRRTILASIMIIGAALAVVFGGGAFSAFNDVENISGTATSAIVDFEISGDGGSTLANEAAADEELTITFDATPCNWAFFAPGDSCVIPVSIYRATPFAQQLQVSLAVADVTVGADKECDAGNSGDEWVVTIGALSDTFGGGTGNIFPAGLEDTASFDVTVQLVSAAGNTCQNDSISVALTVTATTTGTPHSTSD